MEKISMCRVCLREDVRLNSIVGTHLQEMYESLVLMPLETTDGRPVLACYICCARLKNCYELRKSCLQSEELFTQMLSSNESEQVKLQGKNNTKTLTMDNVIHLSIGHELKMSADNVGVEALKCEVKVEPNDCEGDPTPKQSTLDDQRNPEDVTTSNLKDHELVQDTLQAVHKLTAAGVRAVNSTNEVTFTLVDDNKERPRTVPRSERVQYTCDTCQHCYSSKCELERHVRVCSDVWKKDLSRENSTRTHTAHNPHQCNICKKLFLQKSSLIRHMPIHTGEKPYHCDLCDKRFIANSRLRQHIRETHTDNKPHQCTVCKNLFSRKSSLIAHKRTHTSEKLFHCNICKNQYTAKSSLMYHIRTHTGEKPFQCDLCENQYTAKSSLMCHIRTHTGEKPFQCDLCDKRFLSNSRLRQHIRTHTNEKPYQCHTCNKQFSQRRYLNRHSFQHV